MGKYQLMRPLVIDDAFNEAGKRIRVTHVCQCSIGAQMTLHLYESLGAPDFPDEEDPTKRRLLYVKCGGILSGGDYLASLNMTEHELRNDPNISETLRAWRRNHIDRHLCILCAAQSLRLYIFPDIIGAALVDDLACYKTLVADYHKAKAGKPVTDEKRVYEVSTNKGWTWTKESLDETGVMRLLLQNALVRLPKEDT